MSENANKSEFMKRILARVYGYTIPITVVKEVVAEAKREVLPDFCLWCWQYDNEAEKCEADNKSQNNFWALRNCPKTKFVRWFGLVDK